MEGAGMHFTDKGSSDVALIFLHYFGGSGETWSEVVNSLSGDFRCIAPDLRGFGSSPAPDEPLTVATYADDVHDLIQSLGLKSYTLVGHSMGGKIALAVAARKPQGLQSLVLAAPSPPTPEPMSDAARKELLRMFGDGGKIATHLQKICLQPLSSFSLNREMAHSLRASATAWKWWLEAGSKEDISGRMEAINVPALVLCGSADKGMTEELMTKEVVGRLRSARLEIVADSGHLIPLEQVQDVVGAIRSQISA